jgi:ABC-2 type transport system ATP-binding protein
VNTAITIAGLRKSYGDHTVLDNIDLVVPTGTVFALLGPNGAGKTTMVHILSTLVKADGGTVTIAGHDLEHDANGVRASIGLTGQFAAVDGLLTGEENLQLMADLRHLGKRRGQRRVAELLERFDLVEAARKPLASYSGGMKRRLDLAMTLVGDPHVIFLDEPTSGLDPRSRQTMWDIVGELLADGVTVFLTTQHLEEADRLAERVAVLDGGRIVGEGSPAELKAAVGSEVLVVQGPGGASHQIPTDGTAGGLRRALGGLDHPDAASVSLRTPSLDDVFFALTGNVSTTSNVSSTSSKE